AKRKWIEAIARLQQVDANPGFAEHPNQFAFTAEYRRFEFDSLAIGMGYQGQQMILRPAAIERGDQLQDANWPRSQRCLWLVEGHRLHAAPFYCCLFPPTAADKPANRPKVR